MITKPIYTPEGRAAEYGELAINIYTGCNHGCAYCYARRIKQRFGGDFENPELRTDIVESVKKQIDREQITDKLIHLCFACDPYPADIDTMPTREIIKIIKASGNHVQILTKGSGAERDFDLLDADDRFGVTITGGWASIDYEPKAASPVCRLKTLKEASKAGIGTWVSCEPVLYPGVIYDLIGESGYYIDFFKIGKTNRWRAPMTINWKDFGQECERLCKEHGRNYYIKTDLRKEMEK